MRKFLFIFLLYSCSAFAQDKLFFKNGTSRKGILVTNARDYVYFKTSDTSEVEKIKKSKLVLMEDYKGNRFHFSEDESSTDSLQKKIKNNSSPRNVLSIQPLALLFGRANFSYERLSKDMQVGFVIPLILTFDPAFGNIFTADSNFNSVHIKGVSFITGLDINYYFGKKEGVKLFVGPRIRYGTDMAFFNTEAYTIQTQVGLRMGRPDRKTVQHLSVGFGFARVISSAWLRADSKQAHMWFSLNYRFGIRW